jgi:hypothetical protein
MNFASANCIRNPGNAGNCVTITDFPSITFVVVSTIQNLAFLFGL